MNQLFILLTVYFIVQGTIADVALKRKLNKEILLKIIFILNKKK